jgi:hypothetical protein
MMMMSPNEVVYVASAPNCIATHGPDSKELFQGTVIASPIAHQYMLLACVPHTARLARSSPLHRDSIVIKAGMFSNQGWNAAAHQSGTLSGPARRLFFSYGKREWRDDVNDDGLPVCIKIQASPSAIFIYAGGIRKCVHKT